MAAGVSSMGQVESLFLSCGVKQVYIKKLAPRQDNEKNQIVLGSAGAKNVLMLFPATMNYRPSSKSEKKRNSQAGEPIVEMLLDFYWLDQSGSRHQAPNAKIINYFQYPEARFSGFASGCPQRPDCLMRRNKPWEFGKRYIILGANVESGETFGLVINERDDPLASQFPALSPYRPVPVLQTHLFGYSAEYTPEDLLVDELQSICGRWHPSTRLKFQGEKPIPFKGNQGAGYTLEAHLNVPSNALKEPDKHGFEIKSYSKGGKISLMTPTADMGEEGLLKFREFMEKYGWPPVKDKSLSLVFNGAFRYRKEKKLQHIGRTCLLDVHAYDHVHDDFDTYDVAGPHIKIDDIEENILVSGWSLTKLLTSWNAKHASACYVEYEKRKYSGKDAGHDFEYRYTGKVFICEGTDIWAFLRGISEQVIYYDPGHDITVSGKSNQRPQWRMSVRKTFEKDLSVLYDNVTVIQLV